MPWEGKHNLDVLIFGGGGAGLWLLDELRRSGFCVLLAESNSLGRGQSVASQGIIHGGLKYTLGGLLTDSARAIRHMPALWRACLAGESQPDLSGASVGDKAAFSKYVRELRLLHEMMVHAMKAKQTTDLEHCAKLRDLIAKFRASYLGEKDHGHNHDHGHAHGAQGHDHGHAAGKR